MSEKARRLALLRLQAMIAGLTRREALRGLAEALDKERHCHALAQRSTRLLAASAARAGTATGAGLAERMRFASGLGRIVSEVSAAHGDAQRQTAWQAAHLAAAEAKVRRIGELEAAALSTLETARMRAAEATLAIPEGRMARNSPRKVEG